MLLFSASIYMQIIAIVVAPDGSIDDAGGAGIPSWIAGTLPGLFIQCFSLVNTAGLLCEQLLFSLLLIL